MLNASSIGEKLSDLEKLSHKHFILIDELDTHFRPDIIQFLVGETLSLSDGKPGVPLHLYKKWIEKLVKQGFDKEIAFNK